MNVGWGKKETQFHGSEGKSARVVKPEAGDVVLEDDMKEGQLFYLKYYIIID